MDAVEIAEIDHPFPCEIGRNLLVDRQAEEIGHLRGENRDGDTCGEPYHNRVRDELDHRAELEHPHQHEDAAGHESGKGETGEAIHLDDVVDNDDKRAGRSADLHRVAAEGGNEEAADHGRGESDGWADTAGDGESDSKRKGDDADHEAGHQILAKLRQRIIPERSDERRMKTKRFYHVEKAAEKAEKLNQEKNKSKQTLKCLNRLQNYKMISKRQNRRPVSRGGKNFKMRVKYLVFRR